MSRTTASGRNSRPRLTASAPRARGPHRPALVAQHAGQQLGEARLVVHHEHPDRGAVRVLRARAAPERRRGVAVVVAVAVAAPVITACGWAAPASASSLGSSGIIDRSFVAAGTGLSLKNGKAQDLNRVNLVWISSENPRRLRSDARHASAVGRALSSARARAWTRARPAARRRRTARRRPPAGAAGRRSAPPPRSRATAAAGRRPPGASPPAGSRRAVTRSSATSAATRPSAPRRVTTVRSVSRMAIGRERLAAGDLGHPRGKLLGHLPLGACQAARAPPARARVRWQLEVPPLVGAALRRRSVILLAASRPSAVSKYVADKWMQLRRGRGDPGEPGEGGPLEPRVHVELLLNLQELRHARRPASPRVTGSLMNEERRGPSPSRSAVLHALTVSSSQVTVRCNKLPPMRADAGLTVRTSLSSRQRPGGAARDRVLLAVGAAVAAAAAIAYLTAIATHPVAAMLKGFDLRVYLGGARQALSHPGRCTPGPTTATRASSSPTRRSPRCCSRRAARSRSRR